MLSRWLILMIALMILHSGINATLASTDRYAYAVGESGRLEKPASGPTIP
jgi:hypothetical protein